MERQSAVQWLDDKIVELGIKFDMNLISRENYWIKRKELLKEAKKIEIEQQERLIDLTLSTFVMRDNLETNKRDG